MDVEETLLWLFLLQLCCGKTSALRRLQTLAEYPGAILETADTRWREAGLNAEILAQKRAWRRQRSSHPAWIKAQRERETLYQQGAVLLARGRAAYPPLLAEIHDPPPLLFVRGNESLLSGDQLAIVGARKASQMGRRAASEFAADLASRGLVITSGMALGIDAAAHRGALDAGGSTIAVMATGIDRIYPDRHRALAREICASGALVSEFPMGTGVRREYFPQRNRVISGLSLGVLVVEAAPRSGSLITARMALEQNREVLALPHSIYHREGRGCNELLQQGAWPVLDSADILGTLNPWLMAGTPGVGAFKVQASEPELPAALQSLYGQLGYEALGLDELQDLSGLATADILSGLVELQLRGLVEQNQGRYIRCR